MTMNLNSIFGQFSPDYFLLVPMTLASMFMAISWLFFSNSTNWLPTRIGFSFLTFNQAVIKTIFQQTNPNSITWVPIITSIFILLFSVNVLGLLPYAFTATSHISLTYSIGIPIWMSVNILGFYLSFNARLSHLVPQGTPSFLIPLMVIIETLSLFAQPIALGLRLAANLTAGHLLIYLMSTAIWVLMNNVTIASLTFIIFVLLFLLEIGVACIQAYVFTALIHFYLVQNL
nr:ATP synthase F0 subunit 6 [Asterias amurensis]UYK51691.1 ATP synthase F0 subunit 6 [Asterias amurensis]WGS93929.1 ATP synthase F0 subunit 6 [Asterias amurensis]WGS93942.1 ATP synthase F0 subunit 6 [Asterias amurensis]WGS93955.1 ATP synthase F0 subunit 6 [Asterias amurensis]